MKLKEPKLLSAICAIAGSIGAVFAFVPPQTLRAWGLDVARHNDRVLFGILLLIAAQVALYALIEQWRARRWL